MAGDEVDDGVRRASKEVEVAKVGSNFEARSATLPLSSRRHVSLTVRLRSPLRSLSHRARRAAHDSRPRGIPAALPSLSPRARRARLRRKRLQEAPHGLRALATPGIPHVPQGSVLHIRALRAHCSRTQSTTLDTGTTTAAARARGWRLLGQGTSLLRPLCGL